MTAHQRCGQGLRSAGENLFWSKAASFERTSGYEALLSAPEALGQGKESTFSSQSRSRLGARTKGKALGPLLFVVASFEANSTITINL
jgi:hypothetical protein